MRARLRFDCLLPVKQYAQPRRRQDLGRGRLRRREEYGAMAADEAGIELGCGKGRVRRDRRQEAQIGADADDLVIGQCPAQALHRAGAVAIPDDQLGDHRVVMHRDRVARPHPGIDPDMRPLIRRAQMHQPADRRQEIAAGILGIDPNFDRMAVDG